MPLFPGINKLSVFGYSDTRAAGRARDPDRERQPELDWILDQYPVWRGLFDGTALEETISHTEDPGKSSDHEDYRWPVRYNLIKSYCMLHAGMLWGRGRTGAEAGDLFEVRIDPKKPGVREVSDWGPRFQDALQYFWSQQGHILRSNGTIQQWAGGAILKISWNPFVPTSVGGIILETIQPEHFYPIWDPLNFEALIAVKIKFPVSKAVALEKYALTEKELEDFSDDDAVPVEEYWDRRRFFIRVGRRGREDGGVYARRPSDGRVLRGENPWRHPITKQGIIPVFYVPRIRTGHFFGESLAADLIGIQEELNKTLADFGDALTRGTHPAFGISDYTGPGSKDRTIPMSRHGAVNLGKTAPGGTPPKVHEFPLPKVPEQTDAFVDRLLNLSESAAGITPAAKGMAQGVKSGLTMALEMLTTANLVDWERSHWEQVIARPGGINEALAVIWWHKGKLTDYSYKVSDAVFGLRNRVEFHPLVPRDRIEVIDEVVRLATARAVSPQEWLRRLGDIEDLDTEMTHLIAFLTWMAQIEAAVAGRAVQVSEPTNPEEPAQALPEVKGETEEPATKQPAKQPEGQKPRQKS